MARSAASGDRIALITTALVVGALSFGFTSDPDMWWHVRTGELILSDGIPKHDVFSITVPGREWIAHEWLSQVFMWGLWSAGGLHALQFAFAGITLAAFMMMFAATEARPSVAATFAIIAAIGNLALTNARPMIFNTLLLAAFVLLVQRVRAGRLAPVWLWVIVPFTVVWANLHSGYQVGVVFLAVSAFGDYVEQRWGRSGQRTMPAGVAPRLGLITAVAFIASAMNPNGVALWRYPIDTLRSEWMKQNLNDWVSPDWSSWVYWPLAVLLVASVIAVVMLPRRPSATEALLVVGTSVAVFQTARHLPVYLVVTVPILAGWVDEILQLRPTREPSERRRPPLAPALGLAAFAVLVPPFVRAVPDHSLRTFPVAAVDHLEASGLESERIFNDYDFGGYLIFRGLNVYADGRADVYGDEQLWRYSAVIEAKNDWPVILDEDEIAVVVSQPDRPIVAALGSDERWTVSHRDTRAVVFVRAQLGA